MDEGMDEDELEMIEVLVAAGRLIMNEQPCTLTTISANAKLPKETVDRVWRRIVKSYVRNFGAELGLYNVWEVR